LLLNIENIRFRLFDKLLLAERNLHIVYADGDSRSGSVFVAGVFQPVGENDRLLGTGVPVGMVYEFCQGLFGQNLVHFSKFYRWRQQFAEENTAHGCLDQLAVFSYLNLGLQMDFTIVISYYSLFHAAEHLALAGNIDSFPTHVIQAEHDILGWNDDRLAVGGRKDVVRRHHQHPGFNLRLDRKRHVNRHLVTVKVSVEGHADERVKLNRFALDEQSLEGLHTKTMKGWSTVEDNRIFGYHLFQNVPNLFHLFFHHLPSTLDSGNIAFALQLVVDKRFEQLERHLLRDAALVQTEMRPNDNYRTSRVIDTLAKKILAEAALLSLEHVRE